MKNLKILASFQTKKFKYGGHATLLTVIVVVLLIVLNLLVEQVPVKLDLTENRLFTLSEQTLQILDRLEQDVAIYGVAEPGKENRMVDEVARRYSRRTPRVSVEYLDPYRQPAFIRQFDPEGKGINEGSYIVASGDKYRVIDRWELFNINYQNPFQPEVTGLVAEERFTSAIMYVTAEKNPKVYALKGHGEEELPLNLRERLRHENYELKELTLVGKEKLPEDLDLLLVFSPKRDLTVEEEEKIREFLAAEGRALFILNWYVADLPTFQSLLRSYGLKLQPAVIVEGDADRHAGNPVWLLPEMKEHEILTPLVNERMPVLFPLAQALEILDVRRRSLEFTPLLTTSAKAWGKVDPNPATAEKEPGDLDGPFTVAIAVVDKEWTEATGELETRLVVTANSHFLATQFLIQVPGNLNFIMNSLNWLSDREDVISIRPRSLIHLSLRMSGWQKLIYSGIVVILIPLLALGAGVVVWLRRRHL
ncbi:MAG TPA: GldG family protein [Firmicutes bacterium]|jgi:ABC-2 type transport system permease protein|nr:GldG family protein [Bacillota bacterium]